jgi:hypothetical protein
MGKAVLTLALRLPICLLLLTGALALAAAPASAEILILDNGTVLKGRVVRDGATEVVLQLDGFRGEARVTVERRRIVQRFRMESEEPNGKTARPLVPEPVETGAVGVPEPEETTEAPTEATAEEPVEATNRWQKPEDPRPEPPMHRESFFERLARVAIVGMPKDPAGRTALVFLLLVGLFALIGLGGRIAEVETLTFGRAAALTNLQGSILGADAVWSQEMLRADRAIWVLPTQGIAWLTAAVGILRENAGRVILLFAFVLFSLTVAVFTAGAILVSY